MTTSMPSGDGTVTDAPSRSTLDDQAAPTTGLDPDTAADAAGDEDSAAAGVDSAPEPDPDSRTAAAADDAGSGAAPPEAGPDAPASDAPAPNDPAAAAPDGRTVLDGPALENQEMHLATDDLRSSEDKTASAREIVNDLAAKTQPGHA